MDEKIFNHSNYHSKDDSNIKYSHPKRLDNVLFSGVHYLEEDKKHRILYEFEVSSIEIYKSKVKFFLDEPLQEFIEGLDELNIGKVYENSKKWFDKSFDYDKIDRWYNRPIITKSKKGLFILCRVGKDIKVEDTKNQKLNLEDIITLSCLVRIEFIGLEFYKEDIVPVYCVNSVIYQSKNNDVIDSGDESGISSKDESDNDLEEVHVETMTPVEYKEVSDSSEIKTKTLEREINFEHKDEISLFNEESCVFNESARIQIEKEMEKLRDLRLNELREKRKQHREKSKEISNSNILEN